MNVNSLKMHFSGGAAGGGNSNSGSNSNINATGRNSNQFLRTHIPVSSRNSRVSSGINNCNMWNNNNSTSSSVNSDVSKSVIENKWKVKFEEEERKRKTLLMQNQKCRYYLHFIS